MLHINLQTGDQYVRIGQGGLIKVQKACTLKTIRANLVLPILNLSAAWGGVSHDFEFMSVSFEEPYIVI